MQLSQAQGKILQGPAAALSSWHSWPVQRRFSVLLQRGLLQSLEANSATREVLQAPGTYSARAIQHAEHFPSDWQARSELCFVVDDLGA